jgi:hypothetical protein
MIKVDLQLSKILPDFQSGGDPEIIVNNMNINEYKYLINNEQKIAFQFNDNKNRTEKLEKNYFAMGGLTAVFKIKKMGDDKQLILRVMDDADLENTFIKKYKEDSILYGDNMIKIFFWGEIYNEAKKIGSYVITQLYCNENDVMKLDEESKIELVKQLLEFNKKLNDNNYVYRDLKLENIGFERTDGNKNKFIVLDYDTVTLVKKDSFKDPKSYNLTQSRYPYGTFPPLYIKEYYMLDNNNSKVEEIKNKIDKLASTSIATIISDLFFIRDDFMCYPIFPDMNSSDDNKKLITTKKELDAQFKINENRWNKNKTKWKNSWVNDKSISVNKKKLLKLIDNLISYNYDEILNATEIYEFFCNNEQAYNMKIEYYIGDIVSIYYNDKCICLQCIKDIGSNIIEAMKDTNNYTVDGNYWKILSTEEPVYNTSRKYLKYKMKYLELKKRLNL